MNSIVAKPSSSPLFDFEQPLPPRTIGMPLFCDFDGPIINVSDRYYSTYRLSLSQTQDYYRSRSLAAAPVQPLQINKGIRMMTKAQFWRMKQERVPDVEIALRSGLQGEQIEYFLDQVRCQVNQPHLLRQDQLQPGVAWALSLLRRQGFKLVIVTLRCQSQVEEILQRHQLEPYFAGIYGTQECSVTAYYNYAHIKTELLRQAVADHGTSAPHPGNPTDDRPDDPLAPKFDSVVPERGWMIGDTEADVWAAQALGIPTIALTCGIRSAAYLAKLQPYCIHSSLLMLAHHLLRDEP